MTDTYTNEKGTYWSQNFGTELYSEVEGDFNLVNINEEHHQKVVCRTCGGSSFEVGTAYVSTLIRCKTCRWEHLIHEG